MTTSATEGQPAPNFELEAGDGQRIALRDLRGSPVVLVFYPADWSPVCGDQVTLYNEILPEFERYGARIVGISVDGRWCHAAFAKDRKLRFPLLADFEPKGAVARRYGVYREREGVTERALFVIDAEGIIRWRYVSPIDVNPGADGILEALEGIGAEHPPGCARISRAESGAASTRRRRSSSTAPATTRASTWIRSWRRSKQREGTLTLRFGNALMR